MSSDSLCLKYEGGECPQEKSKHDTRVGGTHPRRVGCSMARESRSYCSAHKVFTRHDPGHHKPGPIQAQSLTQVRKGSLLLEQGLGGCRGMQPELRILSSKRKLARRPKSKGSKGPKKSRIAFVQTLGLCPVAFHRSPFSENLNRIPYT